MGLRKALSLFLWLDMSGKKLVDPNIIQTGRCLFLLATLVLLLALERLDELLVDFNNVEGVGCHY